MSKYFFLSFFILLNFLASAQEVIKVKTGGAITVQAGVELTLHGGISFENESSLLNNGTVRLKNNITSNTSNWTDNSASGALSGTGLVIFNSANAHNFSGTTSFFNVHMNAAGGLSVNNNFIVNNKLRFINGKINTGSNYVFHNKNNAAFLENDASNSGYSNSWVNGNLRRLITSNTSTYDFPVGNTTQSNLLQFINNNITGANYLTASFGPKPGTDAGLNVSENGNSYVAINDGGVWYLNPGAAPSNGNYALQLYFNGFNDLSDNQFGILRRPDASTNAADWIVPPGSSLEVLNGPGRKVSDGYARRINISTFSQLGIGMFTANPISCFVTGSDQVCSGSTGNTYSGPPNMSSYSWEISGNGTIIGSTTSQSVNVTAGAAGTYSLTLNVTMNGVQRSCSKSITVKPIPACFVTGPDQTTNGSAGNIYSGPSNMSSYSWSISGNGTIVGSATAQSVSVTGGAIGGFTLTLNTTLNGCSNSCTKTVTVNPSTSSCTISGPSEVTTGLSNNVYAGPASMNSYSWSISGNGTIIGSATSQTVTVTAGAAGSFTLTLTVPSSEGDVSCFKTVTVNPIINCPCSINGSDQVCTGLTNIIYNGPANMNSYSWSISGNGMIIGSAAGQSVNITAGEAGSYTLTLNTTLNECTNSCSKTVNVSNCEVACTYTQGFYGNRNGKACFTDILGNISTVSTSELMLSAFGPSTSVVFGNTINKRFFTLYRTDISNGAIYKMLPGGSNLQAIAVDDVLPYEGASYSDFSTWSLVPIQPFGIQKGKIKNSLLAQTITLWFNLRTSSELGDINLVRDTLVTDAQTSCGSNIPVGKPSKFGLPHNVVQYLNEGNGYPNNIIGLFNLANDVLGGENSVLPIGDVQKAVDVINNSFDGCRILVETIPYSAPEILTLTSSVLPAEEKSVAATQLKVVAYPNPYKSGFNLMITSPVSGQATIEFFTITGAKVYEMNRFVQANSTHVATYTGPIHYGSLIYRVVIGGNTSNGIVVNPN